MDNIKIIHYTRDPHDMTGRRCDNEVNGLKCSRREGHPTNTSTTKKLEDDTEVTVVFNHRALVGGQVYTW